MTELPSVIGAEKATVAAPSPATATTSLGCAGTCCATTGVTRLLAADAAPVPTAFVAFTVKVYDVPFVRPPSVIGDPEPLTEIPSGTLVTV